MNNDSFKEKIPPYIYTKEYYLQDNEGYSEYSLNLDSHIHPKFYKALKIAKIKPGETVLDVGCGRGELLYYCAKQGAQALGIDYSQSAIDIAKETMKRLPKELQSKTQAHVGEAETFNYQHKYDVIFFIEITEHMHHWQLERAFAKFNNILSENGRLIIMTPNFLYEKYLQPLKKLFDIPCRVFKWPLRIVRGKYKPKNLNELLIKIFSIKTDRGELARKMHCNVIYPSRLKKLLKDFDVHIYCEDPSLAPLSLLLKKWMGREIIAIARKKDRPRNNNWE